MHDRRGLLALKNRNVGHRHGAALAGRLRQHGVERGDEFLRESARRNIPVLFISGRISNRSFSRWQSYLNIFGFYLKPLLKSALSNSAAFLMQSQQDADRLRALGAPPEKVTVSGNLKYDLELPAPTPLAKWLEEECARQGRSPLIVAGSVVATEEPLALLVFGVVQGDFPKALLVLAPRKPERFAPTADTKNAAVATRTAHQELFERLCNDARVVDQRVRMAMRQGDDVAFAELDGLVGTVDQEPRVPRKHDMEFCVLASANTDPPGGACL